MLQCGHECPQDCAWQVLQHRVRQARASQTRHAPTAVPVWAQGSSTRPALPAAGPRTAAPPCERAHEAEQMWVHGAELACHLLLQACGLGLRGSAVAFGCCPAILQHPARGLRRSVHHQLSVFARPASTSVSRCIRATTRASCSGSPACRHKPAPFRAPFTRLVQPGSSGVSQSAPAWWCLTCAQDRGAEPQPGQRTERHPPGGGGDWRTCSVACAACRLSSAALHSSTWLACCWERVRSWAASAVLACRSCSSLCLAACRPRRHERQPAPGVPCPELARSAGLSCDFFAAPVFLCF